MRRNSWMGMTLGLVVVFSSLCLASMSPDEIAIEGVRPGDSVKTAKQKFGSSIKRGDEFYFANGVVVEVRKRNSNTIEEIKTLEKGHATPSGVAVGMRDTVLTDHYGKADKVEQDYEGIDYVYYSTDGKKKMKFEVRNGIIQKIKCELD